MIGWVMPVMSASWKPSLAEERARDVAGEREDRRRVHPRGADAGDQVRRAGAAGAEADAHASAGARVAIGHVGARPVRGGRGCGGCRGTGEACRRGGGRRLRDSRRSCRLLRAGDDSSTICAPVMRAIRTGSFPAAAYLARRSPVRGPAPATPFGRGSLYGVAGGAPGRPEGAERWPVSRFLSYGPLVFRLRPDDVAGKGREPSVAAGRG